MLFLWANILQSLGRQWDNDKFALNAIKSDFEGEISGKKTRVKCVSLVFPSAAELGESKTSARIEKSEKWEVWRLKWQIWAEISLRIFDKNQFENIWTENGMRFLDSLNSSLVSARNNSNYE